MTNADATTEGRIFTVSTSGADIVGFDPARDKLDLGDNSVHNFIVVDTPTGVGFMNPWSGETCVILGVSLAQLTIDSFVPIVNDHLRQTLSGALAWEHGIEAAPHTVYARSHELGQIDKVAFDPATDVVDFRYFGTREQIYMSDSSEGVIISNSGTGQALILLGVTKAELTVDNFVFYPAEVLEDRVALQLGFSSVPASQIIPQGVDYAGTTAWPTVAGSGEAPSGVTGTTYAIEWHYGTDTALAFNPAVDKLDFGWFKAYEFDVREVNGSTVISITGNHQTYTLTGVSLGELEINNIVALDTTARAEWQALIDAAPPPAALPVINVADGQVVEGDAGTTQMLFTVTLSHASDSAVSVSYSTLNGTATAGSDYASAVGTVTFAPGETVKTVAVAVTGDTLHELSEAFSLQLSAPSGATINDGSAVGTITDNDADTAPDVPPAISIADISVVEGDADLAHFRFQVTLSKASTQTITVQYASSDGTAIGGTDYEVLSGTITFAPGETTQTIHAHMYGDTTVEPDETYTVTLSAPTNATIADGTAVATIVNDDAAVVLPTLSIGDATLVEGNAGSTALSFTVSLSAASAQTVSVAYGTADGTASAGSDYTAKAGTVTFAPGETSKVVQVQVTGDTAVEANETFTVQLSAPTNATLADGSATAAITNDDVASVPAGGAGLDYDVTSNWGSGFTAAMTVEAGSSALAGWTVEFDAGFTITITNIWNAVIVSHVGTHYVVKNASYNGAVGAGKDTAFGFQATPGAGGTTAGGFLVNGRSADGGMPAPALPTISVSDASVSEGHAGLADLAFTVTLSAASATAVTVAYATGNGTATAGSDYTAMTGTLTFAPGETSKVLHVPVSGDTVVEANETLTLSLSAPSGATIADGSGTGTIVNDDVAPVVPVVSVADASVTEGNSGAVDLAFTVTLSQATTGAVSVHYGTQDGTAGAGSDYAATSGTLTFAAGEVSKVVHVQVNADTAVEANETLKLILSQPGGATIGTGTATGTIVNDDTAAPGATPTISISDTTVSEGNPAVVTETGWFSTSGNQIIDADGHSVQIAGVNWFGFEGTNESPNGLWTRGYKDMMQQMVDEGFNTIRLPFSSDMLHATAAALGIDYAKNPDLAGLTPLEVMDKIVDYAGEIGLKIILDHHRSSAGDGTSANGLWYDSAHSEAGWIADWQMLAARYADDPTVIGADLHNEPYNGTWGGGGATDWARAAEAAGNAIGEVNPNWLIFVEGIATYDGQNYWWGGNLMGVRDRPIDLDVDNKLVYSAHDYPNSVYAQPWFQGSDFPANLTEKFDDMWGYIYREGIAPVYIGEFGTKLTDPKDVAWFEAITSYLGGDFNNDGVSDLPAGETGPSWTYWSWNPNSGDTGGILKDDWTSVNTNKMAYLTPIEAPFPALDGTGGAAAGAHADFTVTLSQAFDVAVSVDYHTVALEAAAGSDFTAASGTVTFLPGETSKVISIPVTADKTAEATEHFAVALSNPVHATVVKDTGTATILDDDGGTTTPTDPTTPTTPADPAGDGLHGALTVVDTWNSGFNLSVAVHNDGTIPTSGWQVSVEMPYEIQNIWNAEIVSHTGDTYVIRNAAWNGTVGADAEVSFGFIGTGKLDPTHVELIF
ncbi:Calx-beta domain-containing protein [Azorhizobium doebereinerae]|uniref:Calx-beta domain-containing protein n=1 Tax=Azorhizobium doebereinerae TaxID=281091 RepID=UPI0009FE0095|nr:Calx-beta domain-containing protein [Azorhizobium doebereinerae]